MGFAMALNKDDDSVSSMGKEGKSLIGPINPGNVVPGDLRGQVQAATDRTSEAVA